MIGILLSYYSYIRMNIILVLGLVLIIINIYYWNIDILIEGVYLGWHTNEVEKGLLIGYILFIISEVILFIIIFWALFHSSLEPTLWIGCNWPPKGIISINPLEVPILNSIIL